MTWPGRRLAAALLATAFLAGCADKEPPPPPPPAETVIEPPATPAAKIPVPRKKPAPDAYLVALERLGLVAPECVAFEDSHVGLQAALAAGLSTVVTPSDYTAGEDFSGAAAVLPDLGGVEVDFVRELLRSARERDRQPLQPAAGHGE